MGLSHVAEVFGGTHAAHVARALPDVLRVLCPTTQESHIAGMGAVRGSALVALAATVRACPPALLLPHLPEAAAGVLLAAEAAATQVAQSLSPSTASKATLAAPATPAASKGAKGKRAAKAVPQGDGPEDQGEGEEEGAEGRPSSELAAAELASALTAVDALVNCMGPMLSPYLPGLLRLTFHPAVLGECAARMLGIVTPILIVFF